jgi:hypothetical protein
VWRDCRHNAGGQAHFAPRSLQGISDREDVVIFLIRAPSPAASLHGISDKLQGMLALIRFNITQQSNLMDLRR